MVKAQAGEGTGPSAGPQQIQKCREVLVCVESAGLTDGADEVVKQSVGEERLRELPEVHLQRSGGHVDVLPLPVLQVDLLIWTQRLRSAWNTARNGRIWTETHRDRQRSAASV